MYGLTDIQVFNKALERLGEVANTVTSVSGGDTTKYGSIANQEYQSTRNEELRKNDWRFAIKRILLTQNTTQPNATGLTYCYTAPSDCLRVLGLFESAPMSLAYYPFKGSRVSDYPFLHERGFIFTELYPSSYGPYCKYIQEIVIGGYTATVTTTNASTTATVTSTAGLIEGTVLSVHTKIPAATTIVEILSATTFKMSAAATGATAETTTFTPYWYEPLFVDALAIKLAAKIAVPVTGNPLSNEAKRDFKNEYWEIITEARQKNAIEKTDDLDSTDEDFWTTR